MKDSIEGEMIALDPLSEADAGGVLHSHERQPLIHSEVEERDDIRVTQSGYCPRFPQEAFCAFCRRFEFRLKDFEGDLPIDGSLNCSVNGPHSAFADQRDNDELPADELAEMVVFAVRRNRGLRDKVELVVRAFVRDVGPSKSAFWAYRHNFFFVSQADEAGYQQAATRTIK